MAELILNIPNEQVDRVKNAIIGLYPIPTTINEETGESIPEFNENVWIKEKVRRWIIQQVRRWEELEAIKNAKKEISEDNELIS